MELSQTRSSRAEINFLDDIVRELAAEDAPSEVLAFPRDRNGVDDYEKFTGHDLNRFIDNTVKHLIASGLQPGNLSEVVGIYAHSNVDFVATMFALSRLGYGILLLSLRLGPPAIEHLVRETGCRVIIHSPSKQIEDTMRSVHGATGTKGLLIPSRDVYDAPMSQTPFIPDSKIKRNSDGAFLVGHSSGSTGLPKPVRYTHSKRVRLLLGGEDMHTFISRPIYYGWSFITLLQTLYHRKTCYLFNTSTELNADNLIRALVGAHAGQVQTTPYNLELMASQPEGVEALKAVKAVSVGGAHLPHHLGDRLTAQGVRVNNLFGSGEAGVLGGSSVRPAGDPTWDYIRIYPWVRPHVHMEPVPDDPTGLLHELIYLPSLEALVAHNSDYPVPGSYRSKDLFTRHSTILDAWKFSGRKDDCITLTGGTNVMVLSLESDIRASSALVREATIVGVGRAHPGLLVFPQVASEEAKDDSEAPKDDNVVTKRVIEEIWPIVEHQNTLVEDVARITADMIRVLPAGTKLPVTDKGNAIRSRIYKDFSNEIDDLYDDRKEAVWHRVHTETTV